MRHPEMQDGEIFIANFYINNLHLCGWKTKRAGVIAYDIYDTTLPSSYDYVPVFVQRSEIENKIKKYHEDGYEDGASILRALLDRSER